MLFLLIIFLFPIAIYCSLLAAINRRMKPVMMSGVWDCIGLIFACSGFLLVAGPAIARAFHSDGVRSFLRQGGGQAFPAWFVNFVGHWGLYWTIYYSLIIVGVAAMLWWRRRTTVIYNLDPSIAGKLLPSICAESGIPCHQRGKRVLLLPPRVTEERLRIAADQGRGNSPLETGTESPAPTKIRTEDGESQSAAVTEKIKDHGGSLARRSSAPPPTPTKEHASTPDAFDESSYVTVDVFPAFYNLSLTWHGPADGLIREVVETELNKTLSTIYTDDNPAAGWLLATSGGLFLLMIVSTAMVILFTLTR